MEACICKFDNCILICLLKLDNRLTNLSVHCEPCHQAQGMSSPGQMCSMTSWSYSQVRMSWEFPLHIKYDTEIAYDTGGVLIDMLSAFWEVVYLKLFDDGLVLTPLLHAQVDMMFSLLGKILSHGYFVTGYLLLRITFPTLAGMLLGQSAEVSDDMLITTLANSISPVDASVIKDVL